MKRLVISIITTAMVFAVSPYAHAQFLKGLKKAIDNTMEEATDPFYDTDNDTNGANAVKGTHADLSAYNPSRIYSLKPGEKFNFTESCLAIRAGISSSQILVEKNDGDYLVGDNGQLVKAKQIDFNNCNNVSHKMVDLVDNAYSTQFMDSQGSDDVKDKYVRLYNGTSSAMQNMSAGQQAQLEKLQDQESNDGDSTSINLAELQQVSSLVKGMYKNVKEDSVGFYILFGHKKYGPYANVLSMMVNDANNTFVALVTPGDPGDALAPMDTGAILINSSGLKKQTGFHNGSIIPLADFTHYLLFIEDKVPAMLYDPATDKKMVVPNDDLNNLKIDRSTGALVSVAHNKVYVDGKLLKTLPKNTSPVAQNIYISKDHSRCAVWTEDGLYLPNGKLIDGVLACDKQIKDGKTILSWIVLARDNKTLDLCHESI